MAQEMTIREELKARHADLAYRVELTGLRHEISAMECMLGEAGYQQKIRENIIPAPGTQPRMLTPEYYNREAGWGDEMLFGLTADPADRYDGANSPQYRSEQDLREIRAIGRFYTECDEVGLGIRDNIVNYNAGEFITYAAESKEKGKWGDIVDRTQAWVDGLLEQNRWRGLREKRPMREAFADGEILLKIDIEAELEFPDIQIADCGHLADPRNLGPRQTERLGLDYLSWSFGIGTPIGRPDRPKGYFFDWFGKGDYQLVPDSRIVHHKCNTHEECKRGVSDIYVAHANLKRASKGMASTAMQAAIQSQIAYIEKMAKEMPADTARASMSTPGTVSQMVMDALGRYQTVQTESFMGGKIVRSSGGMDIMYGPMGTPSGHKLVDVFNAVLRRVAVRWQFSDWMVTGDPSNNNMASSVVAETPFHRSTRTRQGEWADSYEQMIWKALALAQAVGRGPEGVPEVAILKKLIRICAKMPDPKERDQFEENQVYQIQHEARVISVKTWRENVGLDHETEEANFEVEDEQAQQRMQAQAEIEAAANPQVPPGAGGAAARSQQRNAVVQRRAQRKARATESLANATPGAILEAARQADWTPAERRELAAGILYDRADDN